MLERIALAAIIGAIGGYHYAKREEDDPIAHLMSILPQHIVDAIENHIDGIEPITQTWIAVND